MRECMIVYKGPSDKRYTQGDTVPAVNHRDKQ